MPGIEIKFSGHQAHTLEILLTELSSLLANHNTDEAILEINLKDSMMKPSPRNKQMSRKSVEGTTVIRRTPVKPMIKHNSNITVMHMSVTIDGVWICNKIY